jgi:hypothetical protein
MNWLALLHGLRVRRGYQRRKRAQAVQRELGAGRRNGTLEPFTAFECPSRSYASSYPLLYSQGLGKTVQTIVFLPYLKRHARCVATRFRYRTCMAAARKPRTGPRKRVRHIPRDPVSCWKRAIVYEGERTQPGHVLTR